MIKYYLYHIPQRKEWGCTANLNRRLRSLKYKIEDVDRVITCGNVDMAADMERDLNIEYGYGWNPSQDYRRVIKMAKIGGINMQKNHPNIIKETGSKNGKINGIKSRWKLQIPVLQFDLQNNFIAEYPGCNWVRDNLHIHVSHCLRGKKKTAGGFIWKYKS
jgi:hypothetical protein